MRVLSLRLTVPTIKTKLPLQTLITPKPLELDSWKGPVVDMPILRPMASVEIVCLVITFTRLDTTLVRRVMGTPETVKLHG